ncbi:MAG: SDR family oxidoreductase [Pseudomonadota bacterium]
MTDYRGRWALITGASAGIGACFAEHLAAKGANLVLTARRGDRLNKLAEKLISTHDVAVHVEEIDFAAPDASETLMARLADHPHITVDILVNNAGFGLTGSYLDHNWSDHRAFINLMITHYCGLTHLFLPGMVERGFGRIIQVASVAGLVPGGRGHTLYGAAKGFLVSFAQSLAAEYEDKNVYTTALCPGFTYTEFHDVNETRHLISKLPRYMVSPVEPVVAGALDAVERRHVVYVPGLVNKMLVWLSRSLPRPWAAALMRANSQRVRRGDTH